MMDLDSAPQRPHVDKLEREITVGVFVIYATQSGDRPVLKLGRVVALRHNDRGWPWVSAVTAERWAGERWKIQNKGKPLALTKCDEMIVVGTVPTEARKLLADAARKAKP